MGYYNQRARMILLWVFATVAGTMLGILSILTLVTGFALSGMSTVLIGLVGGAGLGGGVGIAQWAVLRSHVRAAAWWIPASVVGGMIGVALALGLTDVLQPLFTARAAETTRARLPSPVFAVNRMFVSGAAGAVVGLVLGGAQWLVLRRQIRSAAWWIVANCVGWMAGLSIGAGMVDLVGIPLSLLITGGVSGGVTGSVLAHLLAGDAPNRPATAQ